MNEAQTDIFDVLIETKSDPAVMLDRMVQHLRDSRQPMELFEALKMRTRHRLGLGLLASNDEPSCPDDVERQLEAGLLDACRETGSMLIEDGQVAEGWMYLRPTGDLDLAKRLIQEVEINDDNYDPMIQVLLHEGVDIARGYHVDTTHLQSTVRIASVLEKPRQWKMTWELTQYGKRLHHQLQYPGDEPFVDFYPAYGTFYSILAGKDVDAGLKQFERKAKSVDVVEHGTGAIETFVDLLDRIGRHGEAVKAAIELMPDEVPSQRVVPMLIEIAGREQTDRGAASFQLIAEYCRRRGDLLGYAMALHRSNS